MWLCWHARNARCFVGTHTDKLSGRPSPSACTSKPVGGTDLEGDEDALDVVAVEERLEELVGEAQADEVLHHLLPQVVVDAVQVLLREELRQAR
jgi:hypothetical protein